MFRIELSKKNVIRAVTGAGYNAEWMWQSESCVMKERTLDGSKRWSLFVRPHSFHERHIPLFPVYLRSQVCFIIFTNDCYTLILLFHVVYSDLWRPFNWNDFIISGRHSILRGWVFVQQRHKETFYSALTWQRWSRWPKRLLHSTSSGRPEVCCSWGGWSWQ